MKTSSDNSMLKVQVFFSSFYSPNRQADICNPLSQLTYNQITVSGYVLSENTCAGNRSGFFLIFLLCRSCKSLYTQDFCRLGSNIDKSPALFYCFVKSCCLSSTSYISSQQPSIKICVTVSKGFCTNKARLLKKISQKTLSYFRSRKSVLYFRLDSSNIYKGGFFICL